MAAPSPPPRPARGLPAEQALKHWSDAEAYAAMREYWAHRTLPFFMVAGVPPNPHELEYNRRRRPLEEALLERLRSGELMATAIPENADPTAARTLVDPEMFSHGSLVFEMDTIVRLHGPALRSVEIFEPPGVPRNVRIIPDWYREQHEPLQAAAEPSAREVALAKSGFRHFNNYRHVTIHGAEFSLTARQAEIVKLLHEAHLRGKPPQFGQKILSAVGSKSMQMFQIFRRHKEPPWSLLIASDGRGYYWLNVRD